MLRQSVLLAVLATLRAHAQEQNLGLWSDSIRLPLVPAAAAVDPRTNKVVVWSSYATDRFKIAEDATTQTAIYDPKTNRVTQPDAYRGHDMFCPGISIDITGNVLVTGGDTSAATSVLLTGDESDRWERLSDMGMSRGYQSTVALSNGNIFAIGGSWADTKDPEGNTPGGKNGEIWDLNKWTPRPGCEVDKMLTKDKQGIYRADNHAWLFGWQDGTVFQAGPSTQMNWFWTEEEGFTSEGGDRGGDDAMCGTATMYDALQGLILTAGGSPSYQDSNATADANIVTISRPGEKAQVTKIDPMAYRRSFACSTVLPDGTVLITGGQEYAVPFTDTTATRVPELWSPYTKKFTSLSEQQTPRTYHSIAVLLHDGRVFSGGGGLCGDQGCTTNHFDAEIFTPPYLLEDDGVTLCTRPKIEKISKSKLKPGSRFSVTVDDQEGDMTFSLVRYGSSTHTVNTDQRRVPLDNFEQNGSTYKFTLDKNPGALTPGFWMLFAMRNGTPSEAVTVHIDK